MTDASPRQSLASIARALGVSTATVSNAFNKPERVSDELRARVLDHARKVGYVGPDPAARHLRRGRSDVVGLVFSDNLEFAFQDQASLGFLAGLSAACGASGRNLLMLAAGPPTASTGASIWRSPVSTAAMDGLIVYSVPQSDPHLLAALARALPVVVVDQPRNHPGVDWVGLDDRAATREIGRHVAGLGHRRIGVVCTRLGTTRYNGPVTVARRTSATYDVQHERMDGLLEGLAESGIAMNDVAIEERFHASRDSGAAALDALLERQPGITAVCCLADVLALGVLDAATRRGLRIPQDLTVTGFDDIGEAERAGLTTIQQPLELKGHQAGRLLLERLAHGERPGLPGQRSLHQARRVLLPTVMQVRRSSAVPASRS